MTYHLNKVLTMKDMPEVFFKIGEKRIFKKNEVLKNTNENFEGAFILIKGCIADKSYSDKGLQVIRFVLKPPCIIGEIYAITDSMSYSQFICLENSELLFIEKNKLLNLLKSDDKAFKFIFESLHKKMVIFIGQTNEIVFLHADMKVACVINEFATEYGEEFEGYIKINFNLTQQLISELIGVNRATVIRSVSKLIEKNIISYAGRTFIVKDLEALRYFIDEHIE